MKRALIICLLLFAVACKVQRSVSFTMNPDLPNSAVDDSVIVTVFFKGFKDSAFANFSGEYLKADRWQEFDADIRSDRPFTFNYLRLSGSGQVSFTLKMADLLAEFENSNNKFRIVLNYHPPRFNLKTWYYEIIPGREFVVVK